MEQLFDPYRNIRFRVVYSGRPVAGVSRISALPRSTEVVRHSEGGDSGRERKSPGKTEYDAVTLERGLTADPDFQACRLGLERRRVRSGGRLSQGSAGRGVRRARRFGAQLPPAALLGLRISGAT
jgi:hypothetical protein